VAERPAAVVALFASAEALLEAVPKVRSRELGRVEAYTPYPVHGLSEALGLKPSPLGTMVFGAGILGAALALLFQWWTSAVDYPVRIGGKAFFSWQAFVPIMFEVMVLFAAFAAGLGMLLILNRLPWFGHPMLRSKAIAAVTRDRFALAVEAFGGGLDVDAARAALEEAGGESLEVLHLYEPAAGSESAIPLVQTAGIVAASVVAGLVMYGAVKLWPVLPPMNHMEVQDKVVAFRPPSLSDGAPAMRLPVEGTVPRGYLPPAVHDAGEAGAVLVNPLPRTPEVFERGRTAWRNYCQVCHGPLGQGKTSLSEAYKAQPANLHSGSIRDYPDGTIFYVISYGKNTMPGYAVDLSVEDRWAVVHYVRALQRSLNAREEDLP